MAKIYRYNDLEFPVADNKEVTLTVEHVSDALTSVTSINVPGTPDPNDIKNGGARTLGTGKALRPGNTVIVCAVSAIAEQEDKITIRFLMNDQLLQEHTNDVSDDEEPLIILKVSFPKP